MCGPQSGEGDADATIYVIGAGIVGLSVAWHLQRRGERVVVVDREEPARGCSFCNAGALSSGSVAPLVIHGIWWTALGMVLDPYGPDLVPFHYWPNATPQVHWCRRPRQTR